MAALLAVLLLRSLSRGERAVVLGGVALAAASALASPCLPQNDAWTHYLHLRAALMDPRFLLDLWDRPGFTLFYAAPAALGITAARLASAVPAVIAAAASARSARSLGIAHSWMAALFLFVQYDFFGEAGSVMTELPFAAALATAILGFVERRYLLAGAALGWCSLTRPEGPLFAVAGALFLLIRVRRPFPILLALLPFPLYALIGGAVFGDPLWFIHANPYLGKVGLRLSLGQIPDSFFFEALRESQAPALILLECIGLFAAVRAGLARESSRLVARVLPLALPVFLSFLILTFLKIGPTDAWRESRYLVAVSPALALFALTGLEAALAAWPSASPPALLTLAAWGAAGALGYVGSVVSVGQWSAGFPFYVVFMVLLLVALCLWLLRRWVPHRVSLGLLLALPLVIAPPGFWAKHLPRQTPATAVAPIRHAAMGVGGRSCG